MFILSFKKCVKTFNKIQLIEIRVVLFLNFVLNTTSLAKNKNVSHISIFVYTMFT